jgi:hypothetical protein
MLPSALYLLGDLLGVLCFLAGGFALGRFLLRAYQAAPWQVQIAIVLGLVLLIVGVVDFAPPAMAAGFVLGATLATLADQVSRDDKRQGDTP